MKKKDIKRGAHAITLLAVCWTFLSAFGVFDWVSVPHRFSDSATVFPLTIWGIHVVLIGIAFYAWRKETPRKVLWLGGDDEILDANPENINLEFETTRFRKNILIEVTKLAGLIFFMKITEIFPSISGILSNFAYLFFFYAFYLFLKIIVCCIRYFTFRYKVKKWRAKQK